MSITPYTISVPSSTLSALSDRLSTTKFPSQLATTTTNSNWDFGTPLTEITRLAAHWREGFDWRAAEKKLNELPNFWTEILVDGFDEEAVGIHFVHQISPVKGAIPLLFVHGWPGSFIEVTKLLPLLKGDSNTNTNSSKDNNNNNNKPAFHVVAPSLPNFGFSAGVEKRGFGLKQYGEVCHKLMLRLGYEKYVTQGGDWGFSITRSIAHQYPSHCLANHLNLILASAPSLSTPLPYLQHLLTPYGARDRAGLERSRWFADEAYGYNLLQSTKPQTIAFALADSPVGLLSWIYEKLHDWTDGYPWTDDEVLTWVSIYQFSTAGPGASARIYYEAAHPLPEDSSSIPVSTIRSYIPHVKLGLAHFPREINVVPQTWGHTLGPVVYQKDHERGGHFAAWEVPEAIVGDLQAMFGKGGVCGAIMG